MIMISNVIMAWYEMMMLYLWKIVRYFEYAIYTFMVINHENFIIKKNHENFVEILNLIGY